MIHVAETDADFERCAEIYNAVEPDRVITAAATASLGVRVQGNAGMRAVNERLGFRAAAAGVCR